jgi:hypothetical protein
MKSFFLFIISVTLSYLFCLTGCYSCGDTIADVTVVDTNDVVIPNVSVRLYSDQILASEEVDRTESTNLAGVAHFDFTEWNHHDCDAWQMILKIELVGTSYVMDGPSSTPYFEIKAGENNEKRIVVK